MRPTIIDPLRGVPVTQGGARELDLYQQTVVGISIEDAGRVYIDWGPGTRAWVQKAREKPKPILEVTRVFQEEEFPGYTAFISNLSAVDTLPSNWLAALRAARGIYLLTCPRTKEQYVGWRRTSPRTAPSCRSISSATFPIPFPRPFR